MDLATCRLETLQPLVQDRRCAAEVVSADAERVEDLMVRRSGSKVECLLAERGEDGVDGVGEADKRECEEGGSLRGRDHGCDEGLEIRRFPVWERQQSV